MKKSYLNYVSVILFILVYLPFLFSVSPSGADVDRVNSTTAPVDDPQSIPAQAGNVTELNIFGYSTTQSWQGYFGNVSGAIQLADANKNVLYNWSLAYPEGEVYASTSDSIIWSDIECFNFSAHGGEALEAAFSIASDDVDGVNETFSANNHNLFYTNNIQINEDSCMSVQLYDSGGGSVDGRFEEVLLWDGSNLVFTSLLEETSVSGFDNKDHDFQMLVLEDGHETDTATTPYYFYVELQ
ncbi:hypothetical protein K9L16_01415 [Candidatus Pacearchaeota archaeon]|nr:hypothetical protein [Candidatus Pacearchaeota archaeon]